MSLIDSVVCGKYEWMKSRPDMPNVLLVSKKQWDEIRMLVGANYTINRLPAQDSFMGLDIEIDNDFDAPVVARKIIKGGAEVFITL